MDRYRLPGIPARHYPHTLMIDHDQRVILPPKPNLTRKNVPTATDKFSVGASKPVAFPRERRPAK